MSLFANNNYDKNKKKKFEYCGKILCFFGVQSTPAALGIKQNIRKTNSPPIYEDSYLSSISVIISLITISANIKSISIYIYIYQPISIYVNLYIHMTTNQAITSPMLSNLYPCRPALLLSFITYIYELPFINFL